MPVVPQYQQQQITEQPLQQIRQQPINAGGGAESLSKALATTAAITGQIVMRDAQDDAFKLQSQVRGDWQQQRAKLREHYKGDDAAGYLPEQTKWWADAKDKYLASASPLVRGLVADHMTEFELRAQDDGTTYVEGEKSRMRDLHYQTDVGHSLSGYAAMVTPQNATSIAATVEAEINKKAIAYGAANGIPSDVALDQLAKPQIQRFHAGAVSIIADASPASASAYLKQFGGSMDAEQRAHAESHVKASLDQHTALDLANSWRKMSVGQMQEALSHVADPDVRRIAQAEWRTNWSLAREAHNQAQEMAGDRMWAAFAQDRPISPQDVGLNGHVAVEIQQARLARARAKAEGIPIRTDEDTYAMLTTMAPAQLVGVNLTKYTTMLSISDLERLRAKQESAKKQDNDVATIDQQVSTYTAALGDKESQNNFRRQAQTIVDQATKDGVAPTFEDRKKMFDALSFDVGSGTWFTGSDPVYQMTDIPEDDRLGMIRMLIKRGTPVTPESVRTIYTEYQRKSKSRGATGSY